MFIIYQEMKLCENINVFFFTLKIKMFPSVTQLFLTWVVTPPMWRYKLNCGEVSI